MTYAYIPTYIYIYIYLKSQLNTTDSQLRSLAELFEGRRETPILKVMVMTTQPLRQVLKSYLLKITQILSKRKV